MLKPIGADFSYNIGTGGAQDFDLSAIVTDTNVDYVLIEIEGLSQNRLFITGSRIFLNPS